jgi:hypothetical protein
MAIGTLLVILAIVLAAAALFLHAHSSRLLAAAVIVGFIGVLAGVGTISIS